MVFYCRICTGKFTRESNFDQEHAIVVTLCGHLFCAKCLEVTLTSQKLCHATSGNGPFRRRCPAYQCGQEIFDNGIIELCNDPPKSPSGDAVLENDDNIEVKLLKKVKILSTEKEGILKYVNKLKSENEGYRETIDEIKAECEEVAAILMDDQHMKKFDKVFWITKEKTLAPGRILEMRKMSSINSEGNCPFAIIKLDQKISVPSLGTERETAIVPISEVITFKEFFKETFTEFRHKLWKILNEAKGKMISEGTGRQGSLRTNFRESSIDSQYGRQSISGSYETIDCIPISHLFESKSTPGISEQTPKLKRSPRILRAKSMYFGMQQTSSSQEFQEKHRSTSWTNNRASPINDDRDAYSNSITRNPVSFSISSIADEDVQDNSSEYITTGEKIIYYDPNSKSPQTGEVACILKYTPCAIVKFDELPDKKEVFQYRTVLLAHLFPYALASPDEKFKIAEAYGKLNEFLEEHSPVFTNNEFNYDDLTAEVDQDDEEYFSTSSAEEIVATIHVV